METEKMNFNITGDKERVEIILREGQAPAILPKKAPIKVDITGTIGTPLEFLRQRIVDPSQINQLRCRIHVDRENVSITLITDEDDSYKTGTIKGVLALHPKFKEFGINMSKSWDPNELGQFFKMNRYYFPDRATNMKLVTDLKNFTAQVNSIIEKQKSEKGDFKDNYSGVVMSNLPETFTLNIPVFKGTEPDMIEVEFYASIDGRDVTLRLVSPGATQLLDELRDKAIDEQIREIKLIAPMIAIIEE